MPLYEYRCKQCGHQFEKIQSFSAPDLTECPVCKGELERLISAPAIQFKGAGWYVNDYAGKSSKPASKSASENGSSSGEKSPASNSSDSSSGSSSNSTASSTPSTPSKSE
ncbi:FmdB family zinc ribbon protein [Silvibacterium acidisoli]|uniref:FmdB family zinc ribbon protein n=1 Tax=Acidobacteriaceae bacterium ZG23-2 TaxID=2883246 RepID=UPI00406BF6A7